MVSSISSTGSMNSYYLSQLQKKQQPSAEDLLDKIDSNGDGSVSEDEFISNRPQEVSEDQATQMWSQLDSNNAGSLTGSQFVSAMENLKPPQGPPPNDLQSSSESASGVSSLSTDSDSDASSDLIKALLDAIKQYTATTKQTASETTGANQSLSDLFGKIDTDGDGSVSQDEFISNRPEDVSEDQAKQMWSQLDTSDTGSLTEDQFVSAMTNQGPPPGPPPGGVDALEGSDSSSTASSASSTSKTSASDELVKALLKAIKEYTTANQSGLYSAGSMSVASSVSTTA
ncbi:MAG: EF-hand domain-containing protein [Deltaproteobacteria bacterium]|nr:EF-hand domain-containing protein [Deltaproteobacteria bacterium]